MEKTKEQIETELLALRASGGDADALDALLRRWQEPLWRYLRSLCGDDQSAWDLLQETCLSIAKSIPRLKQRESFAAMAYRIAHRRYVDFVRLASRQRELSRKASEQSEALKSTEPEPREGQQIRDAVAQLNESDRTLITMVYVEGFSYEEIAGLLQVPLGTVKSRVHHAKARIRDIIERDVL